VKGGALVERGMPRFEELTDAQLDALRHYIRSKVTLPDHQRRADVVEP
jgi:mono/diheme cytochrome c family protein